MEKRKIGVKTAVPYSEAVAYLKALVDSLESGKIVVESGGEHVTLTPGDHVEIEIEAKIKKDRQKFSLEIGWAEPCAADLKISDREPEPTPMPVPEPAPEAALEATEERAALPEAEEKAALPEAKADEQTGKKEKKDKKEKKITQDKPAKKDKSEKQGKSGAKNKPEKSKSKTDKKAKK